MAEIRNTLLFLYAVGFSCRCTNKHAKTFNYLMHQYTKWLNSLHHYVIFRVNDQLVKVNNTDVTNVDRKTAAQAIRNSGGIINMVRSSIKHLTILYYFVCWKVVLNPMSMSLQTSVLLWGGVPCGTVVAWHAGRLLDLAQTLSEMTLSNITDGRNEYKWRRIHPGLKNRQSHPMSVAEGTKWPHKMMTGYHKKRKNFFVVTAFIFFIWLCNVVKFSYWYHINEKLYLDQIL